MTEKKQHTNCIRQPISFFFRDHETTGNGIGERGAMSLGDVLKSNTTLTALDLSCYDKEKTTPKLHPSNNPFSVLIKSTGNGIGETGATSLSDALKSNKSLTQLNLSGKYKRNNTQMTFVNNLLFSILIKSTGNNIGETGRASFVDALKLNTTLTQLL